MQGDWDFVIVGGGSAGCALANRLSADSRQRVLLLESGGGQHIFSNVPAATGLAIGSRTMNWHYQSEPDPSRNQRVDMWPAGRMLGGGSAINGMMFVRGNPWDYDQWAALGNLDWSYADVLPYFKKMEHNERGAGDYRGQGGPQWVSEVRIDHPLTRAFIEGMQELGVPRNPDTNGASQDGVDYCQVTQKNGRRFSAASAYLSPLRGRNNLHVLRQATVEGVELEAGLARAVRYRIGGEVRRAVARGGVVLAAGAIGSPRLLLLSGIGAAEQLQPLGIPVVRELPGVGRNLQEHPGMIVSPHVMLHSLTSDLGPRVLLRELWRYWRRGAGALTFPVGHAQAFVRTRENLPAPNIQLIFSPSAFDHHEKGATPYTKPAATVAVGLCRSQSRGAIRLRSAEPSAPPAIQMSLLEHADDVAQLIEGIRFARRLYGTRAFGRVFRDERKPGGQFTADEELEAVVRATSFLMYHPCGTCRMGNDAQAVVDARLRVHGVGHLWVADASIMPTLPAGNINATCIMIGEKAADLISAQ